MLKRISALITAVLLLCGTATAAFAGSETAETAVEASAESSVTTSQGGNLRSGATPTASPDGSSADSAAESSADGIPGNGGQAEIEINDTKNNQMTSRELTDNVAPSRYSEYRVSAAEDVANTKYAEAAELLSALGIMVGDAESGLFRPNDSIIRSEMTKVVVYASGYEDISKSSDYQTRFPDVAANHWANGPINVGDQQGLIIGDDTGVFRPDDPVLFQEAVTMVVRALGYEPAAQSSGGYPSGYMVIASSNQLLKNIDATGGVPATRGDIAQLVFNALTCNMMEQTGFGTNVSYEVVDRTLLYDRLNVEKLYGQITGTHETTLSGGSTLAEDRVQIGDNIYIVGDTMAAELLGYNVLYYARLNTNADERTLIVVRPQDNKNNVIEISSANLVSVTGDDNARKTVTYWRDKDNDKTTRTTSISSDAIYIYNGKYTDTVTNEQLKPETGNLILLDTDINDTADIVFVNHFSNIVVDTVSRITGRVTDKYLNGSVVFDPDDTPVTYTILKNGEKIGLEDIQEWNVISYTISEDNTLIRAYVSDESITGIVTEVSSKGYRISGSDVYYEIAKSYPETIEIRDSGTFYLDYEGKIAAVNKSSSVENTATKYAYLMNAAEADTFSNTIRIELFTQDGSRQVLDSAAKVRYNDTYSVEPKTVLQNLGGEGNITPQIISYSTNSSGAVNAIYTAKDETGTGAPKPDEFTLNIDDTLVYKSASGKLGNVTIGDSTIIFDIPESAGTDYDLYDIRTRSMFSNDTSYDVLVYDLQEDYTAGAILVTSSTGTAAPEQPILVVDSISETQNENNDYVDKLYGYQDGKAVELLAADNTVLSKSDVKLQQGDIIQYRLNARGEIDGITLLFDVRNKTTEFSNDVTTSLTTVYGKVTRKFAGSVNVQVNEEIRNYSVADATVYLYDSQRNTNNVSVVSAADIEIYEEDNEARLFVKLYDNVVEEMVIVR